MLKWEDSHLLFHAFPLDGIKRPPRFFMGGVADIDVGCGDQPCGKIQPRTAAGIVPDLIPELRFHYALLWQAADCIQGRHGIQRSTPNMAEADVTRRGYRCPGTEGLIRMAAFRIPDHAVTHRRLAAPDQQALEIRRGITLAPPGAGVCRITEGIVAVPALRPPDPTSIC